MMKLRWGTTLSCLVLATGLVSISCQSTLAQEEIQLSTLDEGGGDLGIYNDNQRGAFVNQNGSGGIDIRNLGPDDLLDDTEPTRKRAGLIQFDLGAAGISGGQITAADLELVFLQGSTTAEIELYGVNDDADILGLAGEGNPGFDQEDPDFHFANSGLFRYYEHDFGMIPGDVPDDDDVENGGFFDSTLDLIEEKVTFLGTQSEEGDGELDGFINFFGEDLPEMVEFLNADTNGKVVFLLMPTSGTGVTLTNNAEHFLYLTVDETAIIPGDFDNNGALDLADLNALSAGIRANDASFDVTNDGAATADDLVDWVKELKNTWIGDSNLDGEFSSADFVQIFTAGKFETNQPANWDEGDWNGDGTFDSGDFVAAFTDGGFELGPRVAVSAVPEPAGFAMMVTSLLAFAAIRKR